MISNILGAELVDQFAFSGRDYGDNVIAIHVAKIA
jgi:hypothetical protein